MHEEIVFTGNTGPMTTGTPNHDKAIESLRRLGARVQATNVSAQPLLRWFLSKRGYDLVVAGRALIGLSNSLEIIDGRSRCINRIQAALRLPLD